MPNRPARPCVKHSWILVRDGGVCPLCPPPSRTPDPRPGASARGYGAEHRGKREKLLQRQPWCVNPYDLHTGQRVKATIRDHIVPLSKGGSDDESNEQALCARCHAIKIYRDGSRGRGAKSSRQRV